MIVWLLLIFQGDLKWCLGPIQLDKSDSKNIEGFVSQQSDTLSKAAMVNAENNYGSAFQGHAVNHNQISKKDTNLLRDLIQI